MITRYWVLITLVLCFSASLLLRILPSYNQIFTDLGIKFALNDAYYHMRLIDNLVYNFPQLSTYDPYLVFPGITVIGGTHFFDWLVAGVIWVVGLGSPTQATIDTVGVYFPPVLAALAVIPVYFIGKTIFNKWVGVIAALLIAILPGEFLGRSILGATDHHVAEVLFSTTAIMFFLLAVKATTTRATRLFTVLAGLTLNIYLLTWLGGLLFVLIICLFLVIQIIINHLQGESSTRIAAITTSIFSITLIMNYSILLPKEILLALVLATVLPAALVTLSWFMHKHRWSPLVFPSTLVISGILLLVVLNLLYPSFTEYLGMIMPSGSTAVTTMELQPLLFPQGQFTLMLAWGNFTTTAILAPIALMILVISSIRNKGKASTKTMLIIWSIIMIILTLSQRRYAYYTVINISLLSAYLTYYIIKWSARVSIKVERKNYSMATMAIMAMLLVLVPTNVVASVQIAKAATFAPSNAWQSSMLWMRDNTPEPFGDSIYDNYLPVRAKELPGWQEGFSPYDKEYLASLVPDYSVTAWWDYGYWITRTAHRVPNANPGQNAEMINRVASLLLATDDNYHGQVSVLKSKYVVLDQATAYNKFYAIVSWNGEDSSKYFDYYRVLDGGVYKTVMLFYPEYYETLVSRLYNFDGEAIVPGRVVVILYTDNNIITEAMQFTDYQKAVEYVASKPNTRIVSANPAINPVPLGKMDYKLVYSSREQVNGVPEVKIFEYVGN